MRRSKDRPTGLERDLGKSQSAETRYPPSALASTAFIVYFGVPKDCRFWGIVSSETSGRMPRGDIKKS